MNTKEATVTPSSLPSHVFERQEIQKLLEHLDNLPKPWESEEDSLTLVEDSWGIIESEPYGELTERAKILLTRGQCLGFAEALANAFGTGRVAIQSFEQDSDEPQWDEEKNDFLRDENGYEIPETYREIYHAYAVAPDGTLWDCRGRHARNEVRAKAPGFNPSLDELSIEEAYACYGSRMPEQNKRYAASLVIPLLREVLSNEAHSDIH